MGRERFTGTWKLVSSEFRRSEGNVDYPLGRDAIGMLTFDAAGNMTVQLMRADRPPFASGDIQKGTPEEIKRAFEGSIAYFGRYEINEEEGTMTTTVMGCTFPNWMGGDQKRFFEFSDDRLTFTTPSILLGGSTLTGVLVWQRVA